MHFFRGELAPARAHFREAAGLDEDDLLASYYLVRSLEGALADTADTRALVLARAVAYTKSGEMDEEPLYYAGHIFFENGLLEAAVRCFGRCGTFLPALYMEVEVIGQADPICDVAPYIDFLLRQEALQTARGISGFLHPSTPAPADPTPSGLVRAVQDHCHAREVATALAEVRDRLRRHEAETGAPHPRLAGW